jgi:hypothetical protein
MVGLTTKIPEIKNINYFLFFIFIFITAQASWLILENWFIIAVFLITFFLFIKRGLRIDHIVIYIVFAWIIINIISVIHNETEFDVNTFMGAILKILFPYFILKLTGSGFFVKFEKIIFTLILISIPIFLIQLIVPYLFDSVAPYLNYFVLKEQQDYSGWYTFIYMHSGFGDYYRNCGFMWEPGAFALMIIFGLLLHLYLTDFNPRYRRVIIYLIALASTLSTMGYLVVFIVFLIFLIKQKKLSYFIILLPVFVIIFISIINLDFLFPELEMHLDYSNLIENKEYTRDYSLGKLNRLGYNNLAVIDSFKWPFGNGVLTSRSIKEFYGSDIIGGSAFGSLLLMWGWAGILFWFWATYKFLRTISNSKNSMIVDLLSTLVIVLAFSSNPIPKSPLLYVVVTYPFIKWNFMTYDLKYV